MSRRLLVSATASVTVGAPAGGNRRVVPGGRDRDPAAPAPVVRTARLTVGTPSTCATAADGRCPVNLAALRARDGTATVAGPGEGDFDGVGPPVSLFGAAVPLDRPIRSLTLPADPRLRLYALTLSP